MAGTSKVPLPFSFSPLPKKQLGPSSHPCTASLKAYVHCLVLECSLSSFSLSMEFWERKVPVLGAESRRQARNPQSPEVPTGSFYGFFGAQTRTAREIRNQAQNRAWPCFATPRSSLPERLAHLEAGTKGNTNRGQMGAGLDNRQAVERCVCVTDR